ncbi:endonuclease domain-containing protein [Mycolicibacterium sp.]|uniref:endonuclease domain-containing protein n=1 Tax=Mycolicibacterium sp. TaxID=2320850 RepID=UPI0037C951B0
MGDIVVATEALAAGEVSRYSLRTGYRKLHQNVYIPKDFTLDAHSRAKAAWLWSGRTATLAGYSAAAALGSRWLPSDAPAELARIRHPSPPGILIHTGAIADDEIAVVDHMTCTNVARTCYDIGRRQPLDTAIIRIDALLNATHMGVADVRTVTDRYPGARGIRRLRTALALADAGAESPQETRLRLLLVRAGLPRPVTQIPVTDAWGRVCRRIDMGWAEWTVGVEYDGEQHWTSPEDHENDIVRLEFLAARGWTIVRVSARQLKYRQPEIVSRAWAALRRAGYSP